MNQSAAQTPRVLASLADELEHAGALCDRLEMLVTQLVRASRGETLEIALHEAQTRKPTAGRPQSGNPALRVGEHYR